MTLRNFGTTGTGIKYVVEGNRMSGDVDTSCGNSLISLLCLQSLAMMYGLPWWDCIVDGDDCHFMAPEGFLTKQQVDSGMAELGFKCDAELLDDSTLENVEFNRSRLVRDERGWRFVRNAERGLASLGVTHKHLSTHTEYLRWLLGAARAEAVVSAGVPCVGPLCIALERALTGIRPLYGSDVAYKMGMRIEVARLGSVEEVAVSDECRSSYAMAFNVSPSEQLEFERRAPAYASLLIDEANWVRTTEAIASNELLWWTHSEARVVGNW
jgi:hypothetical protein